MCVYQAGGFHEEELDQYTQRPLQTVDDATEWDAPTNSRHISLNIQAVVMM